MAAFAFDLNSSSGDSGSGSALDSILSAVTPIAQSAITATLGPQNMASATNPAGQSALLSGLSAPSGSTTTIIIVLAVLVGLGFFAFKAISR